MGRFLIDTDTAGDDCVALLLALRWASVEVAGITTVCGNLAQPQVTTNALYTVQVAGREDVPVFAGCSRPLLRDLVTAEYVHGEDGMGNSCFPPPRIQAQAEHAVDALVRLADAYAGELEVIALAPLTNIAVACMRDPSIVRKIRRLWIMGGCNNALGNVTPAAEFNFYVDPEAARMVFQAGFAITMVGWEICLRHAVLTAGDLSEIRSMGTPLSRFFLDVNRQVIQFNREKAGIDGTTSPDAITVAMALDRNVITASGRYFVDIECQGELARGYSAVDLLRVTKQAPNAEVVLGADADRFREMLFQVLRER